MYTVYSYFLFTGERKKYPASSLKYNCYNEFEYIKAFRKPIVTFSLGSNYSIDRNLQSEIRANGISQEKIEYIIKKHS